jgi:hypothetical protein
VPLLRKVKDEMVRLGVKVGGGGLGDGLQQKCRAEVRRHSRRGQVLRCMACTVQVCKYASRLVVYIRLGLLMDCIWKRHSRTVTVSFSNHVKEWER